MLKISKVAQITGISEFDLRNWEKRYGFPAPTRTDSGQRVFSDREIQSLILTRKEHKKGRPLSELGEYYFSNLNEGVFGKDSGVQASENCYRFIVALTDYNLSLAEQILTELSNLMPFSKIVEDIFVPALQLIGNFWHENKINIAQEHFATTFIRTKLFHSISQNFESEPRFKCLFGTLPMESHEGALIAMASLLKVRGITPYYLGAHVPIKDFVECEREIQPQLICISVTDSNVLRRHATSLGHFRSKVLLGGTGVVQEVQLPPNVQTLSLDNLESVVSYIEGFIKAL